MDINRLIRIANHFDKIGAYTISDEFENKFIRTAAPVDDKLFKRNQKIADRVKDTNVTQVANFFSRINQELRFQTRSPQDYAWFTLQSWNMIKTWQRAIDDLQNLPVYKSDADKMKILDSVFDELVDAEDSLKNAKPASVRSAEANIRLLAEITNNANNEQNLLALFVKFVDGENRKYTDGNQTKYFPYINNLTRAETLLYNLDRLSVSQPQIPLPTNKSASGGSGTPTPSGSGGSTAPSGSGTPAPSGGGGSTTPSGSGGSTVPSGGGSAAPSGGGSTQSGTGGGTSTKPSTKPTSTKPTSTKPTSTKPGKLKEDNANLELSNIVFRKYQAAHPEVEKRDILLNMRLVSGFKLKTYFDITKDQRLDGSIRAAIKASPYSPYFKETMLQIYESKLKAAKEVNSEPVTPVADTSTKPSDSGETKTDTKTETKTEEKKDDDFGFRCNREGLFTEIKRMDTLHGNDPDQYMRNYFADIRRVIDCHESIRNSLNHKDNIQLDTSINILEAKYFSLINKTQFPY